MKPNLFTFSTLINTPLINNTVNNKKLCNFFTFYKNFFHRHFYPLYKAFFSFLPFSPPILLLLFLFILIS